MATKVRLRLCVLAFALLLGSVSVCVGLGKENGEEGRVSPGRGYQVCQRQCQSQAGQGAEQQWKCQQRCQEQWKETERRETEDPIHRRDPEREREQERREQEERRRREHEHEREHERGSRQRRDGEDDENRRDPEREQEERRREQEERRRREQEQEQERGRGRQRRDDGDDENRRDPEREREQEERRREQERREQEERRRRERERGRGQRRDDEDEENRRDPEREREERRREQERREQEEREREREHREQEERRRREQERGRGQRRDGEDEEDRRDPQREREERRREQEERRRREHEREHERGRGQRREDEDEAENRRDPEREREERRREQERREREKRHEWEREHGRGRGRYEGNSRDPRRERESSEEERRERGEGRRQEEEQRSREEERRRQEHRRQHGRENQLTETQRGEREERQNPYYFQEQRFQSRYRSDVGHIRVLEKFSERSDLLKGIENHRFVILEAEPQTFIIPHHVDAASVLVVVRGTATITSVSQDKRETKRESYNLESGDVLTIPSGTTFYVVNQGNENLQILKLVQPVNKPGQFQHYFTGGGENLAYYNVFSNDVLEAALNTPRDELERLFSKKGERQAPIIRASQEQLKALSQRSTSPRKGGDRRTARLINLQRQTPIQSNKFGQLLEVCPDEFPQLRDIDVAVGIVDIKQRGMMAPHFNSKATWVLFVSEGEGSFEMACPHAQSQGRRTEQREETEREGRSGQQKQQQLHRVTGRLTTGGVLVIPAGHPIAVMANQNENLRLVGFGINAENNQRNFLAGKDNIMNELEKEAKELTFNVEGKQVEQIFKNQKESFFTEGPKGERRRSSGSHPLLSILNFGNHF